jgi:hypothetical protein
MNVTEIINNYRVREYETQQCEILMNSRKYSQNTILTSNLFLHWLRWVDPTLQ